MKKMKQRLLFCLFLAGILPGLIQAQVSYQKGLSSGEIRVGNRTRSFLLYLPARFDPAVKSPVIFLFHGGGGTARSMMNISFRDDFKSISEKEGVILVAPEGIDKSWNDGRNTKAHEQGVDDLAFFRELLSYMETHYGADPHRVYATGISNGGFMVSRLACEMSDKLTAVAVVAATMGKDIPFSSCQPSDGMPVMYIHGTADPIVPFEGGEKTLGAAGAFVSHRQVIEKWIALNGCPSNPEVYQLPDLTPDGTTITRETYSGGRNGSAVISYVIHNGGHTWPGGKQYLPKMLVGRVSRDMNACAVIWDFFRQYRR